MTVCAVCGLRIKRAEERDRPWLHDDPAYDPFKPPIHAPRPSCCNPDCERDGNLYVGDLTTLGDYACSLCEVYIVGDGNDD